LNYPVISLFSGAGGLDLGLERAGLEIRVCVEIASYCQETINLNRNKMKWGKHLKIFGDINKVEPIELLRASKLAAGEVFLVAGGPPCQPFSTAGKRLSVQDPRGRLFYKYVEMIEAIRPRFFLFENVRGILSAAIRHRPRNQRGAGFPPLEPEEELGSLLKYIILPTFRERLGYEVVYGLVNFADYGTPQYRERVIFIGSRDGELGSYEWLKRGEEMPINELFPIIRSQKGENGLPLWGTLGEALRDLHDPAPEYTPYSPERAEVFKRVPPGCNWRYLRDHYGEDYVKKIMGGAYYSAGGRSGFWRRLSYEEVCPTIITNLTQKGSGYCHPEEVRPLSIRECARVQQFDDDHIFAGTTAQKYIQIGNAVPLGAAEYWGKRLIEIAEGLVTKQIAV